MDGFFCIYNVRTNCVHLALRQPSPKGLKKRKIPVVTGIFTNLKP